LAYTELYFANTVWPEFGEAELRRAIHAYAKRDRRFGGRA
jgi:undecaprenyl diphosphate synthase